MSASVPTVHCSVWMLKGGAVSFLEDKKDLSRKYLIVRNDIKWKLLPWIRDCSSELSVYFNHHQKKDKTELNTYLSLITARWFMCAQCLRSPISQPQWPPPWGLAEEAWVRLGSTVGVRRLCNPSIQGSSTNLFSGLSLGC